MNSILTSLHHGTCMKRWLTACCAVMLFAVCAPSVAPAPSDIPGRGTGSILAAPQPYAIGKTVAVPGTCYSIGTSTPGDVVYLAGDLPLIISVPHGGSLSPNIPSRKGRCGFINTNDDDATIDLALDIVAAIRTSTNGGYPHVIINNLSRTKIDQNRERGKDCNPTTGRGERRGWTSTNASSSQ